MHTLVDILIDAFAMTNLSSRQRVDGKPQVRYSRFAHFLLVCHRRDGELAWLLME
jgi:hypothetical protein